MAKNQRQRRPLQDDTRQNKQTVRERATVSRRQRDRIEENRDRREQRRERERLRRQTVDSVRSPKEDVRTERFDSRLIPVEDTFLGRPVGFPKELPVVIGERWDLLSGAQTLTDATWEQIEFDTGTFTTERNGYPALYSTSTRKFTIPGGLAGIWEVSLNAFFSGAGSWSADTQVIKNGSTIVAFAQNILQLGGISVPLFAIVQADEGDYFEVQASQYSGASDKTLSSSSGYNFVVFRFLGK